MGLLPSLLSAWWGGERLYLCFVGAKWAWSTGLHPTVSAVPDGRGKVWILFQCLPEVGWLQSKGYRPAELPSSWSFGWREWAFLGTFVFGVVGLGPGPVGVFWLQTALSPEPRYREGKRDRPPRELTTGSPLKSLASWPSFFHLSRGFLIVASCILNRSFGCN